MILVIGSDEDPTTTYFVNFLQERNAKHVFLNQKYLLYGIEISTETLAIFGQKYLLADFSGVLNRLTNIDNKGIKDIPLKYWRCFDVLNTIIDIFLPNVLNPSYLGFSNDSKLFQSISIKTDNIKILQSFVLTNLPVKQTLSKLSDCNNHIVKSLSSIRSIVQHFENNSELFLDQSKEPVLFQELIEGINIRVHVIDDVCIATKVYSDALDYRYGKEKTKGEVYDLPTAIRKDCILISRQLQLRFCGIDLIKHNNEYYFFRG